MVTERRAEKGEGNAGFGVEGQWVMEALRGIIEMAKAGILKDEQLYKGSPEFSAKEAKILEGVMDQGRVRVNILPFNAYTYMHHQLVSEEEQPFFRIDIRCDVASVVRGIMGTDLFVYQAHNKHLVEIAKDISRQSGQVWPNLTH